MDDILLVQIVSIGKLKCIFVLRIPPTKEIEFWVAWYPKYANIPHIFHST